MRTYKFLKWWLVWLIVMAILPPSLARAEGGVAIQPYWTFPTDAAVTHLQTGDIDGDGMREIILITADNLVQVLENNGDLAWRYEPDSKVNNLLVADLDDNKQTDEIFISGQTQDTLLSDAQKPIWTLPTCSDSNALAIFAVDLNQDGRRELLEGTHDGTVTALESKFGMGTSGHDRVPYSPIIDIWAGDIDGDGRPEIVPAPNGGNELLVYQDDLSLAWRQFIEGEVGLVQAGDVEGDGRAEIVVLTTSWELYLVKGDGKQIWRNTTLAVESAAPLPATGQMLVYDLNDDGQTEIVVLTPAPQSAVHVFKGDGRQLWQFPLAPDNTSELLKVARLTAADVNGDGQAEVGVVAGNSGPIFLLNAGGQQLASYFAPQPTGPLAYSDLNGDGQDEILVGTETGLQVFGVSAHVESRERWRSPFLGTVTALALADLDGDDRNEVIAGSDEGIVTALAEDGYNLWQVDLKTAETGVPYISTLNAGDVDGDGHPEVVAGTPYQIFLLDSNGLRWAISPPGIFIANVAAFDLSGDGWAEIIAAGESTSTGGMVSSWDGNGQLIWGQRLAETGRVRVVDSYEGQILAGTDPGQIYRLAPDGTPIGEYELGSGVLDLQAGLALTRKGQVYRLDKTGPTLVRELDTPLTMAGLSAGGVAMRTAEGKIRLAGNDEMIWRELLEDQALSLAVGGGDDGQDVEVVVSTNKGHVHFFGPMINQPPLLTGLDLAETRTGYIYSAHVNDPDKDTVTVTLEIWNPSVGLWLTQPAQTVPEGQGWLKVTVPDPFDTWDSGQESRFRFSYDDGHNRAGMPEIPGPFSIPTMPWYGYYGRWAGLGALVLLPVALGWLFYRRQQAYRCSPVGRAESLLKDLRTNSSESLVRLHTVTRSEPELLAHLPGLASEAGETSLANLSEGFHLIITRPEVVGEGLEMINSNLEQLPHPTEGNDAYTALTYLYESGLQALQANTVSRILAWRASLTTLRDILVGSAANLMELTSPLVELDRVIQLLHNYQRVETIEDKVAYLAQTIEGLGRLDREFQVSQLQPERNILSRIAAHWLGVTTHALQDLQGRAQLEVSLKTHQLLSLEQVSLSLELTNTGRSPASNIIVTLLPGPGYTPQGDSTVQLDILPAGRSTLVQLPVSTTLTATQFRVEIALTFDDRERPGKSLAFADQVQLLQPATEFRPIPNPYAPGAPLRAGSPIFFGRDDLFQFITENMVGLAHQNILVLIGQRRMGKTSFLQQLPARLGEEYLPVYLDGQSLGIDPGMANFFYDLALIIVEALNDQGVELAEPVRAAFEERPSATFERTFLPSVFEIIGQRQLLLLFDEFEELEMRVVSGKLEPTIFSFFRHLMQHSHQLDFIFVGTHRLEALSSDYWSIFFNIALYKHVTFLDEAAAQALIIEPVARYGLLYDDLALDKMMRVTAGHPYFLQLICHALVNRANRQRRSYLTIQDVNNALDEMVELGEAHFAFLWEQSSQAEQLILAALNRLLGQEPTVTAIQLVELLAERGVAMEVQAVRETLRGLVERDIVREIPGQPPRYEYKVELIRLWVERYKVLGRVVEEMGEAKIESLREQPA